jgi:hypothetical protein
MACALLAFSILSWKLLDLRAGWRCERLTWNNNGDNRHKFGCSTYTVGDFEFFHGFPETLPLEELAIGIGEPCRSMLGGGEAKSG